MGNYPNAVQSAGTLTVSASGTGEMIPARSNSPFRHLSVTVLPEDDSSEYSVVLYQDGEILDSHSYASTTDRVVAHMSFPNLIFPATFLVYSAFAQWDAPVFYKLTQTES